MRPSPLADVPEIKEATAIKQDDGRVTHPVTFNDDVTVFPHQRIEDLRDRGYEVYAFGNNHSENDNLTAVFIDLFDA